MPIYEFSCGSCGARFEDLVPAGTSSASCPDCGAAGARRVLSPQAEVFKLVKTRREYRKQEARNAQLRARAKERFKRARAWARAQAQAKRGAGGA